MAVPYDNATAYNLDQVARIITHIRRNRGSYGYEMGGELMKAEGHLDSIRGYDNDAYDNASFTFTYADHWSAVSHLFDQVGFTRERVDPDRSYHFLGLATAMWEMWYIINDDDEDAHNWARNNPIRV